MIIRDNQPIQFNTPSSAPCLCDDLSYSQLVNDTDVSQFQIEMEVCNDAIELVVNGNFIDTALAGWTNGSLQWSAINNTACYSGNVDGILSQDILAENTYYRLELNVLSIDNGAFLEIQFGGHTIDFITTVGKHTLYGFGFTGSGNTELEIIGRPQVGAGVGTICIDNVSVKEMNLDVVVALKDKDGNLDVVRDVPDFITQEPSGAFTLPTIDGQEFNLSRNYLTVFFDWTESGVDQDCYTFCIVDNCINTNGQVRVPNGEFNEPSSQLFGIPIPTLQPWVLTPLGGGSIGIGGGELQYSGGAPLDSGTAVQTLLTAGTTYDYEINVTSFTPGVISSVQYGTQSIPITGIGVISGSIVADGTDLTISFSGAGSADIEYIRHRVPDLELFFDQQGVEMSFSNHDCTLLINGCNDEDGFGFGFGDTGFSPTIRVESKLVNAQYPYLRRVETNSNGRKRVGFFDRKKVRALKVERQPEYVHDFLSLMPGFDHFYIEKVEFIVDDDAEYLVEYGDLDTMGAVTLDVVLKQEIIRNAACLAEGAGCVLPPNFLLQEAGDLILGENGELILVTG